MKKYIYTFLLLFSGLLQGCSDFLDSKPLDFTATSNFYQDANDAEAALTGCYGRIGLSYGVNYRTGIFLIGNVGTDEILGNPYSTPDAESNMDQFINGRVVKSNKNIRDLWAVMYSSLYSINELLFQLDKIEMNETRKEEIKAEARFLRGWHYMYLGMIFGGVPVYSTVPHETDKGRNSLEEVMKQAIEDLDYAWNNLSDEVVVDPGKATKWAAGGYLAKLYSYLASSKKYGTGNTSNFQLNSFEWVNTDDFYTKALSLTELIIDNSGLKLIEDYRFLFLEGSKAKQQEELLFTYLPSPSKMLGFDLAYYLLPVGLQGGGWGTCRPTQEVLSRYNKELDIRGSWVVGGLAHYDCEIEVLDNNNYFKPYDPTLSPEGEAIDGDYCVNKFRVMNTVTRYKGFYAGLYPLLRLSEIYLLKAEAVAHIDGNEAGREVLKTVRQRSLIDLSEANLNELQAEYRRTDFIEELLDERSRELCFEQVRKFDLVRFNRYVSTIKSISTTYGVWNRNAAIQLVNNISETQIWSPIPEEDEIANPNLKPNNPGY
ncbi:RagB/SusD family nutrient uptake outer membrane protein [Sunxiuqinia elliptica]|uniref:Putative outer membrane starch-binding protein n=1 Tax=Sunxiuqinia elliptica TaxID=655355 RepID=A0A4R6GUC5_9BACT|nr:RagB/SusD family nutrient uptake outer membrane protein [Sunxiuqinia elliptica]TDN99049.1 putative outer membrane starch-binding protein [Sunxiuqinia elliptica]TDO56489.1 putative outer membrane starch-binding protein [Sunxiuqinia elliptica]